MTSLFPEYKDKTISLKDYKVTGLPLSGYEPNLLNWLSRKLVSTQKEVQFALSELGIDLGLTAPSIKNVMDVKTRAESFRTLVIVPHSGGPVHTPRPRHTATILFPNTTDGGATQRFKTGTDIAVFLYYRTVAYDTATDPTPTLATMSGAFYQVGVSRRSILTNYDSVFSGDGVTLKVDSSGYAYGFDLYFEQPFGYDYTRQYAYELRVTAIQGWEH